MCSYAGRETNVAVTGAAGLIGSALCRAAVKRGAGAVTAIDVTPVERWQRLTNVEGLARVSADAADPDALTGVLRGHDVVVHLASGTDMVRGADDPLGDFSSSLAATCAVAEAARASGVGTVVFASSSAVYGELASRAPARETDGPLLPISTYGAAKMAGEGVLSAYAALFGLRVVVVRPGTVVGGGMDRGVLPSVIAQLVRGGAVRMLGDGSQARSFVLVDDLVDAVLHVMRAAGDGVTVYNVGGHGTTTVADVVRIALATAGATGVRVEFAGDERGWRGDVSVVALDLGAIEAAGWRVPRTSDEAVAAAAAALLADPPRLGAGEPSLRR